VLELRIDSPTLNRLLSHMELAPVSISLVRYPRSGHNGRYCGTLASGFHSISLNRDLEPEVANEVLCHELGHAKQVERLGGPREFIQQWWREMAEAGISREQVQSGTADPDVYRSTPLEAEAWEFCDRWLPICHRLGGVVRRR
jgi:hypothetical protein